MHVTVCVFVCVFFFKDADHAAKLKLCPDRKDAHGVFKTQRMPSGSRYTKDDTEWESSHSFSNNDLQPPCFIAPQGVTSL